MAEKLKERRPNVVTLIGGSDCEAPMSREIAKQVSSIDFVFSGPALIQSLLHDLGESSIKLLEFLMDRKRLDEIESAFSQLPQFDARQELSLLPEKGLIFEERARCLSLVSSDLS